MKSVEVVAAVIKNEKNEFLCVQRGINSKEYLSKKWEFPGGKVELGEELTDTVIREINEELSLTIEPLKYLGKIKHQYPDFNLEMHAYLSQITSGNLTLNEHLDFKWLTEDKLSSLDWAEADLPIVEILKS